MFKYEIQEFIDIIDILWLEAEGAFDASTSRDQKFLPPRVLAADYMDYIA
jgi:hypothetical protein